MTDIDDRIRDHYRSLQPQTGMQMEIDQDDKRRNVPLFVEYIMHGRSFSWVVAVLLLIAVTLGAHHYGMNSERTLRTLNEVAMYHSTRLQLEFEADNIEQIHEQMSQLQFEVALPSDFRAQFKVIGARYCTINGELAAHVKFVDVETNKQMSLFMTRSVEGLKTIDNTLDQINGVNVFLWNESGLFYAMAARSPLLKNREKSAS